MDYHAAMLAGILLGLGSAVCHSLCYLFTRLFILKRHQGVLRLLTLGHIAMGLISAAALPILWPSSAPPLARYAVPVVLSTVFYFLGQFGLFVALRRSDASRVSPLLTVKLAIIAVVSIAFLDRTVTVWQWLAVMMAIAAALVLNYTGGRLGLGALLGVTVACLGYAGSDLSIGWLVTSLERAGIARQEAVLFAVALCYALAGGIGLLMLPVTARHVERADWAYVLPFSLSWLAAMVCLFGAFATVGVIYGGILQSTRGLLSIAAGAIVAKLGHLHLEQAHPSHVLLRRFAAAALMTAAVVAYGLGGTH